MGIKKRELICLIYDAFCFDVRNFYGACIWRSKLLLDWK